jgi:hypothetical protein
VERVGATELSRAARAHKGDVGGSIPARRNELSPGVVAPATRQWLGIPQGAMAPGAEFLRREGENAL